MNCYLLGITNAFASSHGFSADLLLATSTSRTTRRGHHGCIPLSASAPACDAFTRSLYSSHKKCLSGCNIHSVNLSKSRQMCVVLAVGKVGLHSVHVHPEDGANVKVAHDGLAEVIDAVFWLFVRSAWLPDGPCLYQSLVSAHRDKFSTPCAALPSYLYRHRSDPGRSASSLGPGSRI